MATGKKTKGIPMINRTVKFELQLTPEQEERLIQVSQSLTGPWNWVCDIYRGIGNTRQQELVHNQLLEMRTAVGKAVDIFLGRQALVLTTYTTFISFLNALPDMSVRHKQWQGVPTDWQRQTIDMAMGSWASFFALRKNGDPHARPPKNAPFNRFLAISGCSSFSVRGGVLTLAPQVLGKGFQFNIPTYAWEKITEALSTQKGEVQGSITKFVIRRTESNLSLSGQYFCSVSYKYPMPDQVSVDERVYVALGASSIGVKNDQVGKVINLWRPDKYWRLEIDGINKQLKNPELKKGSRRYSSLVKSRRRKFEDMSLQQRQNHREVARQLLGFGKHFVVSDYVVRSKPGKLADGKDEARGGPQGLNWAAQNTGSFLDLLMVLKERVKEVGGSVEMIKMTKAPKGNIGKGSDNKLAMAEHLRQTFLNQT